MSNIRFTHQTAWYLKHWTMGIAKGLLWPLLCSPHWNIVSYTSYWAFTCGVKGLVVFKHLYGTSPNQSCLSGPQLKMLQTTDLSCEVYRAFHRFANVSVAIHFIADCQFESWPGHRTIIQIFNGVPQSLPTDIRIVPQLWQHNCFCPCPSQFITNYYNLTPHPCNPQTICYFESCFLLLLYISSSICTSIRSYPACLFLWHEVPLSWILLCPLLMTLHCFKRAFIPKNR